MLRKVRTYLDMIRFPHTVFALPFALMGAVPAVGGIPSADKLFQGLSPNTTPEPSDAWR